MGPIDGNNYNYGAYTPFIFSGHLTGAGGQLIVGTPSSDTLLTLTGNNAVSANGYSAFSGSIYLDGSLIISSDASLGSPSVVVKINAGGLEATSSFTLAHSITTLTNNAYFGLNTDSGATLNVTGLLSTSNAVLTKLGSGTLILANPNNTMQSLGISFYDAPGTLITTSNVNNNRNISLGAYGGNFSPAAGTTLVLGGTISDGGDGTSLGVTGPGTVVLTGTNTFSGGVALAAGTLRVNYDHNMGTYTAGSGNGGISFGGGALEFNGIDTTSRPVSVGYGSTATIIADAGSNFTIASSITGAGSVNLPGYGNVSLTADNTYSGGTTITNGFVHAGPVPSSATTGPLGSGPVTLGASGILCLSGGKLGSVSQVTLSTTGYNQDIVVEKSASPAGYQSAVTTSFDDYPNTNGGYALYEQGYVGPNNTNGGTSGLPTGGAISSTSGSGATFQLQPYTARNVLLLNPSSNGLLALGTQGAFQELNILAAAVNGAATVSCRVDYSDFTSSVTQVSVPDWFTNTTTAYSINGRISLSDGTFQLPGGGYPKLYEIDLPIPAADQSKAVEDVYFDDISGGTLGVFAVSGIGQLLSPTQNYPNNVNVTGYSYITLSGSPTSTMGTLSIGSQTLNVEGPVGYTLTFANTVISGNAAVTSTAPLVNLGAVTGTGSLTPSANVTSTSIVVNQPIQLPIHPGGIKFVLNTGFLSIAGSTNAWTGQLDLTNNAAIITGGNLATISNQIASGYASGTWTGTGITSSTAAADPSHLTALGAIVNDDGFGNPLYSTSDGAASPTDSVIVSYTYYGDTNLSGIVDGSDYSRIDFAYTADQHSPGSYGGWYNGDFNYDGVVNGSDYALIDNAYNSQGSTLAAEIAGPTAIATDEILPAASSVPEPASVMLSSLVAFGLLGRRRHAGSWR